MVTWMYYFGTIVIRTTFDCPITITKLGLTGTVRQLPNPYLDRSAAKRAQGMQLVSWGLRRCSAMFTLSTVYFIGAFTIHDVSGVCSAPMLK